MRAGPGVATDAKSNEITAICLTDTLIKCGGHDESVDVVGIHLIRFGRVQNQYRPPGLCVVFRDGVPSLRKLWRPSLLLKVVLPSCSLASRAACCCCC